MSQVRYELLQASAENRTGQTSRTETSLKVAGGAGRESKVWCEGPAIHRVWPLSHCGPGVMGRRGPIDQPVRTNEEGHVNGTFISPAGRSAWHSGQYEYVQSRVHGPVCTSVCVCNPRAQVALLKGAKWRLWPGFDKWPLNTKATFANFGDWGRSHRGEGALLVWVHASVRVCVHAVTALITCTVTDGVWNGLILLQSRCQTQKR